MINKITIGKSLSFSGLLFALALIPFEMFAQTTGVSGAGVTLQNPLAVGSLPEVLFAIVDILMILAVPVIIFFIVYAGFLYVTAQGNATKVSDAHRALLYALIGGVIILGAQVIGAIVAATVGSISAP